MIGIENFDNTKILIDADDKLPDNITLKNVAILMSYVTKYDSELYPQIFLEKALLNKHGIIKYGGIGDEHKMRKRNKSIFD